MLLSIELLIWSELIYTNIFVNPVKSNDLADQYKQDEPFFILRDSGGIFRFSPK